MNRTAAAFDVPRFSDWLGHVTGEAAEVMVTPMSGGASCEMFRVERLGRSWVVRRAPLTAVSHTAHHVVREVQVIESLAGSAVPVPTILAVGDDPAILGAPFFVMSYIDGEVVRRNGLPEGLRSAPPGRTARRTTARPRNRWCARRGAYEGAVVRPEICGRRVLRTTRGTTARQCR